MTQNHPLTLQKTHYYAQCVIQYVWMRRPDGTHDNLTQHNEVYPRSFPKMGNSKMSNFVIQAIIVYPHKDGL